ncbi:MAG TPA: toxin-antitoxin system [Thermoanaerobaculia bacterium]|jgi:plasmid stability protein|nr:toxin-antitoxin system [Thermoanaerobaculia bacterium]
MVRLVIRQLADDVKEKLELRARRNGRSTEEEVREILRKAVESESGAAVRSEGSTPVGLGTRLAATFRGIGIDEEIPELRGYPVIPIEFDP